jgi:hypothetical protein
MIELQGDLLLPEGQVLPSAFQGLDLGRFEAGEAPVVTIGNHRLEGKRTKMPKPFAVVRKTEQGLAVEGIVEEKLVFRSRPKPVSRPDAKKDAKRAKA